MISLVKRQISTYKIKNLDRTGGLLLPLSNTEKNNFHANFTITFSPDLIKNLAPFSVGNGPEPQQAQRVSPIGSLHPPVSRATHPLLQPIRVGSSTLQLGPTKPTTHSRGSKQQPAPRTVTGLHGFNAQALLPIPGEQQVHGYDSDPVRHPGGFTRRRGVAVREAVAGWELPVRTHTGPVDEGDGPGFGYSYGPVGEELLVPVSGEFFLLRGWRAEVVGGV